MEKFFSFFYELIGVSYPRASWTGVLCLGVVVGGVGAALLWGMAAKSYRDLHSAARAAVNVTVQESPNAELRTKLTERENEVTRLSGVVDRLQNDLMLAESKSDDLRQQLDDREKRRQLRDRLGAFAETGRQL